MTNQHDLRTGKKTVISVLVMMIILGLFGATSCKSPEKFKFDKPKFNISNFFQRSK